jgi:argininosuccinate lyase
MKLWQKKYGLNKQIDQYTVGNDYILDKKLIKYDCLASIAHAKMLGSINFLKDEEVQKLVHELNKIILLNEQGEFTIDNEQEDVHTAIENFLTQNLGELGKKIHTARSRNDQVLTALRLYYKDQLQECKKLNNELMGSMNKFNKEFGSTNIPGFTHTRKAMPSSVAMWAESFIDSIKDNNKLIDVSFDIVDQSPLGVGAGYGVPLKIDRELTANLLNFKKVQKNPIYVQNSRGKFELTIMHALNQIMQDLNKIATDLIIFSMPEFSYFQLPEEFCTGSSIMPHKKNPDVLELIRAKYHVLSSYDYQIRNTTSNLISGYHRDLQLTKEPVFNGFEIVKDSLSIMTLVFSKLNVNRGKCHKAMTKELYATEEVYRLVKKGIPFRDAYKIISDKF